MVNPSASNQSLCIKDSVLGVGGQLVLGSISNQTLALTGEGHVRWSDAVTLVIGDDLHTTIFEHSNTEEKKKKYSYDKSTHIQILPLSTC